MKKVILSAALALAVAGSWAFYPKAPAEEQGYMMLQSQFVQTGMSAKLLLSTYAAKGAIQRQEIGVKYGTFEKQQALIDTFRVLELRKLNEYRRSGWHLVQVVQPQAGTMLYVLDKP